MVVQEGGAAAVVVVVAGEGGKREREKKKKRLDEIPLSAPNQYAKYLAGNQIAIMFSFPRRRICLMKRRQIRPAERVCRSR